MTARLIGATAVILLCGCHATSNRNGKLAAGGDPRRGAAAIVRYGCGSCHTIRGIANARALVGPPLTGLRDRVYIAGTLPNTPANLIRWIRDPKNVNPATAMPRLPLHPVDAVDIAAYIYSIP
ncbi:MAG TPA: c-type cytochrome [Terriglobales bacterium]|nr:c-type cytochrome [Terriglobales bacterium]